ncbi:hypothetical protein [Sulfurirhabdus autotrophica]|uniref:Uncharacterized protein n=1 Tax=Sulfurirhabdus autotrophica TaxID=1706046 RepID=A0A4R3Y8G6_9PROT|nr:hypothetical protein [Sulfurirhabdus autotrophica]TCV88166.1 hypothetical protein EDC63_104123 [Sulfurirhabdus autotrophica]
MNPTLSGIAEKLNNFSSKEEIAAAIDELEDQFDALNEVEQEIAERLITLLDQRLIVITGVARE